MRYRFKVPHRNFKPGDAVPETWDAGIVGTMLAAHRIESVVVEPVPYAPVSDPAAKMMEDAPNKMMKTGSIKRKGVA